MARLRSVASCAFAATLAACGAPEAERGRQLFAGQLPLQARIAGHDAALPAQASRCVNCHSATGAAAASAASAPAAPAFGGPLVAQRLVTPLARRGGPPSRFDELSLCRLLRTGVDPAHVVVAQAMPRYEVSDADCRALWAHLSGPAT